MAHNLYASPGLYVPTHSHRYLRRPEKPVVSATDDGDRDRHRATVSYHGEDFLTEAGLRHGVVVEEEKFQRLIQQLSAGGGRTIGGRRIGGWMDGQ